MREDIDVECLKFVAGGNVKKLPQSFNPAREHYVRKVDASRVYPFGRHIIDEIAKKAGAIVSVRGCIAYDTEIINRYLESCRVPGEVDI